MATVLEERPTISGSNKVGRISQVIGAVVDVTFEQDHLPAILSALETSNNGQRLVTGGRARPPQPAWSPAASARLVVNPPAVHDNSRGLRRDHNGPVLARLQLLRRRAFCKLCAPAAQRGVVV